MPRERVSFSSTVAAWAMRTVKTGVVAFKIDASPLAICVSPQTIRQKGTRLFKMAMTAKLRQSGTEAGIGSRRASKNRLSMSAARPTRPRTIVSTGSSAASTLKK